MSSTPNKILKRPLVADYKIKDLPDCWHRFTIITDKDLLHQLSEAMQLRCWNLSKLLSDLKFDDSQSGNFSTACIACQDWVEETIQELRTVFIEQLDTQDPVLDDYRINDVIDTIVQWGAFLAYTVNTRLQMRCRMLDGFAHDDAMRVIQKDIDHSLILWIDDFRDWAAPRRQGEQSTNPGHSLTNNEHPHWNNDTRELSFRGKMIKQYKWHPAPNQTLMLHMFEELEWPQRIGNPLSKGFNPKQLNETITSLNKSIGCPFLRFEGDGTGKGITWKSISS